MTSYALILAVALMLNGHDKKMLALTTVVGAGIFLPIPDANFYLICALVEVVVGLFSYQIGTKAALIIVRVSALLIVFHLLGWLLNGYPPASPYHAGVKFLEHAELVLCCLFSRPILARFTNV